jgi:predicted DNA-binding transcriptional regulator YafY
MATNKHAQIRYKVLDDCFSNFGRKFYFDELLKKCNEALAEIYGDEIGGVKTRTLRSDISYLRERAGEYDVDIISENDGTGYFYRYSKKDFSVFRQGFNQDELNQLRETILMLQRFKGLPNFDWMTELAVKLEDKLKLGKNPGNFVSYEENTGYVGLDWFKDIFDAITNSRVLHITYSKFNGSRPFYWDIHPYFLKQYNNRWFLFGLNDYSKRISILALDRIDDLKETRIDFIPNTIIDLDEYFKNIIGITKENGPIENVRLQFSKNRFPYVETKPIHSSQKIIDHANRIIEINVIPNKELLTTILTFGNDIEVLSPEHIRNEIRAIIEDSLSKY